MKIIKKKPLLKLLIPSNIKQHQQQFTQAHITGSGKEETGLINQIHQ